MEELLNNLNRIVERLVADEDTGEYLEHNNPSGKGAALKRKRPSFRHSDLRFVDLSNTNVSHVSFYGANLVSSNFVGADISKCDFMFCDLRGANFEGANWAGSKWRYALADSATKLPMSREMAIELGIMFREATHKSVA